MPVHRSFLIAAGNHARKVAKVFDCGADNVILDSLDRIVGGRVEDIYAKNREAPAIPVLG